MNIIIFLFTVILVKFDFVTCNKWDCADYYWRDYYGTTPQDAIPAGKNQNGDLRYVGLVYIRGFELLPATIYPKQGTARTTAYANVLNTNQHVKILCSPNPEAFEWISIESKDLHQYTDRNLIPGGSEVGESLFIGRVYRDNDVLVGKIFRHERANRGIWFPSGNSPASSLAYEILLYNCEKVERPKFDVRSGASSDDTKHTY